MEQAYLSDVNLFKSPSSQSDMFDVPIKGHHAFASVVGTFFNILGARVVSGELLATCNGFTLCPDLVVRDACTVLEVKAASTKTMFRVAVEQLNKYKELGSRGFRVLYALFEHGMRDGFKRLPQKTIKSAMGQLALNTRFLLVLDLSIICRGLEIARSTDNPRMAFVEEGVFYGAHLSLSHTKVRKFLNTPVQALAELGLSLSDYFTIQSAVTGVSVGDFGVSDFPITYILRKDQLTKKKTPMSAKEIEILIGPAEPQVDNAPF